MCRYTHWRRATWYSSLFEYQQFYATLYFHSLHFVSKYYTFLLYYIYLIMHWGTSYFVDFMLHQSQSGAFNISFILLAIRGKKTKKRQNKTKNAKYINVNISQVYLYLHFLYLYLISDTLWLLHKHFSCDLHFYLYYFDMVFLLFYAVLK